MNNQKNAIILKYISGSVVDFQDLPSSFHGILNDR